MFKSAATKIAHNTTIPALAGNSDLRPLQDLITAEKTVLISLQRLRVDLAKAGDALQVWGQGEGDDLGDILTASSTLLSLFATALATYSSLHHTIRDSMKSIRTREEALDDLRRRRRRVGANAEAAEKKLNKMSPEHKNLGIQTDTLNRLREEMRAMDGEIVREEAELGDYKRKCTKDWMGVKFGGLVECCEKGMIVGDIGRQIIQCIPEDITQLGLPRAYYSAHGHVGDRVVEAQRAVSQVAFSSMPSEGVSASAPASRPPPTASQDPPAQTPFLPTPSLGSELTLGVSTYAPPPGPPPGHTPAVRRASIDELGAQASSAHAGPQFPSLPANKEHDPAPALSSVGPTRPHQLSVPYDSGVAQSEENQSLMASIADALSQSHRGFTLEEAASLGPHAADEPVPKYESVTGTVGRSVQSEPHGPATNGHVGLAARTEEGEGSRTRRATRRSTSPPSLPPGAAPAAVRAWDDKMGQGEDGAHSDRPASSSAGVSSQRPISSSDQDGEDEDGLAYDRDSKSFEGGVSGDGKHQADTSMSESGGETSVGAIATTYDDRDTTSIQRSTSTGEASNVANATSLSRAESQWRIPRVPPPSVDPDNVDVHQAPAHRRESMYSLGAGTQQDDEIRTDESADEKARHAAAAREVSRAMDELEFSAVGPPSALSGYATPKGPPPGYGLASSVQSQVSASQPRTSPPPPPSSLGRTPYNSVPPVGGDSGSPTTARPMSPPMYRSPPPEYPRPTPPFSSPLMARSTSSLNGAGGGSLGGAPRTISAAAFRRPQARSPSAADTSGPADTSPLTLRKPTVSPSPSLSASQQLQTGSSPALVPPVPPKARLSVVNPDPRVSDEEEEERGDEFDYIAAYGGESAGYGAGRYVSNLERH